MKSESVTKAWEFYRDNCPGFKEPMRKEFRRLDEYVANLESDNDKLRELVRNMWEFEFGDNSGANDIWAWHEIVDAFEERIRKLGI